MTNSLELTVLPDMLAICRLAPAEPLPAWADAGAFCSVTRTADELSIVCAEAQVPGAVRMEGGWRAFKVTGPLAFELTGVLARLTDALAQAGISLFAISTYETDYILVREKALVGAVTALRAAGHRVNVE